MKSFPECGFRVFTWITLYLFVTWISSLGIAVAAVAGNHVHRSTLDLQQRSNVTYQKKLQNVGSCNEVLCASQVSKCLLTQACKCDLKKSNQGNCSCCKECIKCLSIHFHDCCSCLDICEVSFTFPDTHSQAGDLDAFPELFNAFASEKDPTLRWTIVTFPTNKSKISLQETELIEPVKTVNCSVLYMAQCMSSRKCKASCESMGSAAYRWFFDGCCECVGDTCLNYGINESRCIFCSEMETGLDQLSKPDDSSLREEIPIEMQTPMGEFNKGKQAENSRESFETGKQAENSRESFETGKQAVNSREIFETGKQAENSREIFETGKQAENSRESFETGKQAENSRESFETGKQAENSRESFETGKQAENSRESFETGKQAENSRESFKTGKQAVNSREIFETGKQAENSREIFETGKQAENSRESFETSKQAENSRESFETGKQAKNSIESFETGKQAENVKESSESGKQAENVEESSESGKQAGNVKESHHLFTLNENRIFVIIFIPIILMIYAFISCIVIKKIDVVSHLHLHNSHQDYAGDNALLLK